MKKKNIFVIDENTNFIHQLGAEIGKYNDLCMTSYSSDGQDALNKLKMFDELDVLILNLILPTVDGYQILREIQENSQEYPNIKLIICLSTMINDRILKLSNELGADHFIKKPCSPSTIVNYINLEKENTLKSNTKYSEDTICKKITRILHSVGIPAHIKGYHFIRLGVEMVINEPDLIGQITKTLYPEIAQRFGSSPTKVERAIRHAIEIGCSRCNQDAFDEIFGYTININKAKPTNSEFIAMIADYIMINDINSSLKDKQKSKINV